MLSLGILLFGIATTVFWIVLWAKYKNKFDVYITPLDGNEYFLKDFFFIGYGVMDLFHIQMNGKRFQDKKKKMVEIRGERYAQFYAMTDFAAQFTYVIMVLPLGSLLAVVAGQPAIFLMTIFIAVLLVFYVDYETGNKIETKREEVLMDFPHALSKMALLINAGMPLREVIASVVEKGEGRFYDELQKVLNEMNNGVSDYEAFYHLSDRSGVKEVKKLASVMIQNIRKGSEELAKSLMDMSAEVWQERVGHVKEQGEKASTKLMLPMFIIFGGILLVVIAPMISSMNVSM